MIKKYWSLVFTGVVAGWLARKIEPLWLALLAALGVGIVVGAIEFAWHKMTAGDAPKSLPPN